MNDFLSWYRHLLVPFLFHDMTSLHPPSFHRNDFNCSAFTIYRTASIMWSRMSGMSRMGSRTAVEWAVEDTLPSQGESGKLLH